MHPVEVLLTPLGWAFRAKHADAAASIAARPELATPNRLALSSPSFADGAEIPARHCGVFIGADVSPALTWGALPAGTRELLLVLENLNSPGVMPRIHTIAALPPDSGGLAEGALTPGAPGIRFLPGRRGPGKYAGPRPLPGHGTHRYRFHLYALDEPAELAAAGDAAQLPAALDGHVLAAGTLTGTRKS